MGVFRHVDDCDVGKMVTLQEEKYTVKAIATRTGFDRKTVSKYLAEHAADGLLPSARRAANVRRLRGHRKAAVTRRRNKLKELLELTDEQTRSASNATKNNMKDKKMITVHVCRYPSVRLMARGMSVEFGIDVSPKTVRSDLIAMAWVSEKKQSGPKLTDEQKAQRLAFCKHMRRKSAAYLRSLCFSDESWFDLNDHGCNSEWVNKNTGQRAGVRGKKAKGVQCFVWAAVRRGEIAFSVLDFDQILEDEQVEDAEVAAAEDARVASLTKKEKAAERKAAVAELEKKLEKEKKTKLNRAKRGHKPARVKKEKKATTKYLDSPRYIKHVLQPHAAFLSNDDFIFQQDGASCHWTPESVNECERLGITMLDVDWPANSCDLAAPIEHLWAILKRRVSKHGPRNKADLCSFVRAELAKVTPEMLTNLVNHFRKCLDECIRVKGDVVCL